MVAPDPKVQKDLDKISAQVDFERELQQASETMEIHEIFDEAQTHGEQYYAGFYDGFWRGRELLLKSISLAQERINELYNLSGDKGLQ